MSEKDIDKNKDDVVEGGEEQKKKQKAITIKFSDLAMYETVADFLGEQQGANAAIVAKAIEHYKNSSTVNEAIEALPDTLTNVFSGGGDSIEMAITTIRNTFVNLANTTAAAVDERETKVRKHYEKRISSLEKNIETLEANAKESKSTEEYLRNQLYISQTEQDRADSEAKVANEKVESLESSLKDKEQLIVSLEESKKSLMEQSTSKDKELSELREELKDLSKVKAELVEAGTQLKLKDQEILNLVNDGERLNKELDLLKGELSDLRSIHKTELLEVKNESKQELAELKAEHKSEVAELKADWEAKSNTLSEENKSLASQLKEAQTKINELYEQLMKSNQKNSEEK